jgi:glycosyltransferase involved in cell wall biosynthesis
MRIAQIAPLTESVPPQTYGGTERVVAYLTEALVQLGHDVTLYASGDSSTTAELRACADVALRFDPQIDDPAEMHEKMMKRVLAEAGEYDIIHFHLGWYELPHFANSPVPCVTTMHGRMDMPAGLGERLATAPGFPLVSISDAQRAPQPNSNWVRTVYHGLPDTLAIANRAKRDYVAFLGRISPEKRPDRAIEIARRAGWPIKIAAKVDRVDREYYEAVIAPLLVGADVEFVGEVGEADKMRFLAGAHALLFPIDWPEPFGLVMIEAMACGTPVIAYDRGSVREVITDGETGFIVDGIESAAKAVAEVDRLDRGQIRTTFRRRFTAQRMARDYLRLYETVIERHAHAHGRRHPDIDALEAARA